LWIGGASNEKCQSQPRSPKNKSPQNLRRTKRQARKAKPKQNAIYDKLEKNMNERQARKIRNSMKKKAHKRYLKKSTRDEENKNKLLEIFFLCKLCLMFTNLTVMI